MPSPSRNAVKCLVCGRNIVQNRSVIHRTSAKCAFRPFGGCDSQPPLSANLAGIATIGKLKSERRFVDAI